MKKQLQVEKIENKFKILFEKSIKCKKFELAMSCISAASQLYYDYNQKYVDDQLENEVDILKNIFFTNKKMRENRDKNRILFYDAFGFDNRGISQIYLKSLVKNGYNIVYVTTLKQYGKQNGILKILGNSNKVLYLDFDKSKVETTYRLIDIFEEYNVSKAFLYSTPDDVVSSVVFSGYKGIVKRYKINLTDHAFWLGTNAFDCCIEFRELGAGITAYERKVDANKITILPFYPRVNKNIEFHGFPFDDKGKKVVFSGGALYKTFGDKRDQFYYVVDKILDRHNDVIFMYAGEGDNSKIQLLEKKYRGRVFLTKERDDLFAVLKHCTLYLNTYPISGGLMMQYAALAGKIPLTIKCPGDTDGMLVDQEIRRIEYLSAEELIDDVDKLLSNDDYLNEREKLLKGAIIDEYVFDNKLYNILNGENDFCLKELDNIGLKQFRDVFKDSFNYSKSIMSAVARKSNRSLLWYFPFVFFRKTLRKFIGKI